MITCRLCQSNNVEFLQEFKPYTDKSWEFPVYQCRDCRTRFALRPNHRVFDYFFSEKESGPYTNHYRYAQDIRHFLQKNDLTGCEKYLARIPANRFLIRRVKSLPLDTKLLEIGCSTGGLTAYLNQLGYPVLGLDISPTAVNFARAQFGDLYTTDLNDEKFDVIIHKGVIGCVDYPLEFLADYLARLQPNGRMFFNFPHLANLEKAGGMWLDTPPPDLIYIFSEKSFAANLDRDRYELRFDYEVDYYLSLHRPPVDHWQTLYPRQFNNPVKKEKQVPFGHRVGRKFYREASQIVGGVLVKTGLIHPFITDYGHFLTIQKR